MPLHSPDYTVFIEVMKAARKGHGVTQAELARRIGQPQSFVSKYERQERRVDVVEFVQIMNALNLDRADWIRIIESSISKGSFADFARKAFEEDVRILSSDLDE